MTDYQSVLVDNIVEDMEEILEGHIKTYYFKDTIDEIKLKLESRIESYDRERKEQIERDLPAAIVRAMADVL